MTIVVGFPGMDTPPAIGLFPPHDRRFVVLGADSEEGGSVIKSSVKKIQTIDLGTCKCLLAGSGDGDFADFAIQEISQTLAAPFTLAGVREHIEEIVTSIYADRIDSYPEHEREDLWFQILGAIWVKGEGVQLIGAKRAWSLVHKNPATIGIGTPLARYLIDTYHLPSLPLYHTSRLAVYLLAQVKKHVPACGGTSQVVWMDDQGNVEQLMPGSVAQHERSAAVVMDGGAKWLLHFVDPMGWGFDAKKVDSQVDGIAATIKKDIHTQWEKEFKPPQGLPPGTLKKLGELLAAKKVVVDQSPSTPASSDPKPLPESDKPPSPAS